MKPQPIISKKSFRVIQLFRNINSYGKDEKSFEDRKDKIAWKPIESTAGFVKDNVVHLPETILEQPNFEHCDLILLIDDNFQTFQNVVYTSEKNICFRNKSINKFDFLQIKLDEKVELYLKPGYFEVGFPERNEFKVCELTLDKSVSIKINGKRDFSLTGRRARTFIEQEYIFNYIGDFTTIQIEKEPFTPIVKNVPTEKKVVDLMKPLW
ncbi:hypothetical protein EZ428_17345 [Pedobacter frigiditerrae]|uniref:Uncharacterized protein n=1 Tax=Pedobacter frigiditerrae TaxID=2530452 RepID=A0A4R0MS44_9SPHI|nr:hypothetical protein [Pedobacter frigiditerrae]TCC89457.1 hypothetical protein EZ428_17345 [Pedobacter frigiditerrae]